MFWLMNDTNFISRWLTVIFRARKVIFFGAAFLLAAFCGWLGGRSQKLASGVNALQVPSYTESTKASHLPSQNWGGGKALQSSNAEEPLAAHVGPRAGEDHRLAQSTFQPFLSKSESIEFTKAITAFESNIQLNEMERSEFKSISSPTSDRVRVVIKRPSPEDVQKMRANSERIAASLRGRVQDAFLVDSGRAIETFTSFWTEYVVLIRDLDVSSGGEEQWLYEFRTDTPNSYDLSPDGSLVIPHGVSPIMSRSEWSREENIKRFNHLFTLKNAD